MREALAQGKSEARVDLTDLTKKPHLYAVGAAEGLKGEIAVIDGHVITTQATNSNLIDDTSKTPSTKATYLVGDYVDSWKTTLTGKSSTIAELEKLIEETASKNKLPKGKPFLFKIEGKAETADLHVIRGACPMHARMKKIELSDAQKPFEAKLKMSDVQIIGVFAKNRVGDLTHPATSIHAHVVYTGPSGQKINGHIEDLVMAEGASVSVPGK